MEKDISNTFWQRYPLAASLFCALFVTTIFFMSVSFRSRAYGTTALDPQIVFRLSILSIDLLACLYLYRFWFRQFIRIDNLPLAVLAVMFVASAFYAPSLATSFGCAFSVLVFFVLAFTSLQVLGTRGTLLSLLAVVTFIQVLSLGAYVFFPEIGHGKVWHGGHQVRSNRMSGIVGANAVGASAELALLLIYFLRSRFTGYAMRPAAFWFCVLVNLLALALSQTRTSMASLLLALAFASTFNRPSPVKLAMLFATLAAVIFTLGVVDFDWLLTHLSRSGSSEEILTGTGRTYIWRKASELIAQRPITGWGYASSAFILPQFKELGDVAPHCHNLYLQLAFSVGWAGPVLFITFLIVKGAQFILLGDVFRMTLLLMTVAGSFTEAGPFIGLANTGTLFIGLMAANEWRPRQKVAAVDAPRTTSPELII